MRKLSLALVLVTVIWLAAAAVAAAANGPIQVGGQQASTDQQSGAASGATQQDPSNTNISIRVLSPGDDGDVTQSNTATSSASAGNQAGTSQTSNQASGGGSGVQTSQQSAGTDQLALALSAADQAGATNSNLPIRVLSPGSDGSVTQTNSVGSQSNAGNTASTTQSSTQGQDGSSCGCDGSSGVQEGKQTAGTQQGAGALSTADQEDPSNTNVSIRVLSPGDDGDVTQTNSVSSSANAGNNATTTQNASQSQDGSGCECSGSSSAAQPADAADAAPARAPIAGQDDAGNTQQGNSDASSANAGNDASTNQQASQGNGSGSGIQTGDQSAETDQLAGALSDAKQIDPSNTAGSVRVLSPGDGGDVTQTNSVSSSANAGNMATTTQNETQTQDAECGCLEPALAASDPSSSGSSAIQVAGQQASTGQAAFAASGATQTGASNDASPVRVLSPGDGGDVTQSNTVGSAAGAGNTATTGQTGSQTAAGSGCGCSVDPIQVLGQKAGTQQGAIALSKAAQVFGRGRSECGCDGGDPGNTVSPVRVWSPGDDGDVSQTNAVNSSANAGNRAATTQDGSQAADGSAIQVLGQEAWTGQPAFAASVAAQLGASNDASGARVRSPGGGGDVTQSNSAGSAGNAGNAAETGQGGSQYDGQVRCGCALPPIQVLGQKGTTDQGAFGLSGAFQLEPSNLSDPVRVKSPDALTRREELH